MYRIIVVVAIFSALGSILGSIGGAIRHPEEREQFFRELEWNFCFIGLVCGLAFVLSVRDRLAEIRATKDGLLYPKMDESLSLLETDAEYALWIIGLVLGYFVLKLVKRFLLWVYEKANKPSDA